MGGGEKAVVTCVQSPPARVSRKASLLGNQPPPLRIERRALIPPTTPASLTLALPMAADARPQPDQTCEMASRDLSQNHSGQEPTSPRASQAHLPWRRRLRSGTGCTPKPSSRLLPSLKSRSCHPTVPLPWHDAPDTNEQAVPKHKNPRSERIMRATGIAVEGSGAAQRAHGCAWRERGGGW